jgi:ferredoxin
LVATRKGPPIAVDAASCTGCLICELRCSLRFEKAFNPSKSQIRIRRLVRGDCEYDISFTDRCDNCGICVRYCPYGALIQEEKEETV